MTGVSAEVEKPQGKVGRADSASLTEIISELVSEAEANVHIKA